MKRLLGTLRARLLLSHLVVVVIGVVVLLVAGRGLGSVFVDDHLQSMLPMMRGMASSDTLQLEEGITAAFDRALLWATVVSELAAMAAATVATARVLSTQSFRTGPASAGNGHGPPHARFVVVGE